MSIQAQATIDNVAVVVTTMTTTEEDESIETSNENDECLEEYNLMAYCDDDDDEDDCTNEESDNDDDEKEYGNIHTQTNNGVEEHQPNNQLKDTRPTPVMKVSVQNKKTVMDNLTSSMKKKVMKLGRGARDVIRKSNVNLDDLE